jgi:hypothetical protein
MPSCTSTTITDLRPRERGTFDGVATDCADTAETGTATAAVGARSGPGNLFALKHDVRPRSGPGGQANKHCEATLKEKQMITDGGTSRHPAPGPIAGSPRKWPSRRVARLLTGLVLVVGSVGVICAGAFAALAGSGGTYVDLGAHGSYRTDRYGLATDSTNWRTAWFGWAGSVRLKVASAGQKPIFVGAAAPDAIGRYLSGVGYTTVAEHTGRGVVRTDHDGGADYSAGPGGRLDRARRRHRNADTALGCNRRAADRVRHERRRVTIGGRAGGVLGGHSGADAMVGTRRLAGLRNNPAADRGRDPPANGPGS